MKNLYLKRNCILMLPLVLTVFVLAAQARAEEHPSHIPTRQAPDSPYGTQWAKPPGVAGSYIYNDPRLSDPASTRKTQRSRRCPAPLIYDPTSGMCR
jgi:hypothetical protein